MKHPYLQEIQKSRQMIGSFAGYDHNLRIQENEFYDMQNMSSDQFPLLGPRNKRGRVRELTKPNGLFSHVKLCWVDGTEFWYGGSKITGFTLQDNKKTFVAMGALIVIFPDKAYYNTADGSFGFLENSVTLASVTATPCLLDGTAITPTVSPAAPAAPSDGDYWVDTSVTPHVLKMWSANMAQWQSVATNYVKISGSGIAGFSEYDAVTISGMPDDALNGSLIVYRVAENAIVVSAMIDAAIEYTGEVTIARVVPDMDYVTESENRLWGCSSANNEIYACVQGDPTNWSRYLGISTDAYAMTVGTPGDFTGAITHLGYVMFFKAGVIHKIYGNRPANYQLTNVICRGIEKGSEKSAVIVNETLYYKSGEDVCAYTGSLPSSISQALGTGKYKNAVAGGIGSKYYINMQDAANNAHMFVFDEVRGMWHREDGVRAEYFAALKDELYFIDTTDKCLYSVGGTLDAVYKDGNAVLESDIESYAETGDIGLEDPDNKWVSKIQLRVVLEKGAWIRVSVQYDKEENIWTPKYDIRATDKRSYYVPIIPYRCDTMRIRIDGTGKWRIYSLAKTLEDGSEMV